MTLDHSDLEQAVKGEVEQSNVARQRLRENLLELERVLREARTNERAMPIIPETGGESATHWRWPWRR